MLTCITCSKQATEDGEEEGAPPRGTPSTKEAVKSLTAQVPSSKLLSFVVTGLDLSPD